MIGDVMRDVADLHEVTVAEIRGGRRTRNIAAARHAAIWVLRQVCENLTEKKIAEAVGLSDHTTVIYALRKIDQRIARGDAYAANLSDIVDRRRGVRSYVAIEHSQRLDGCADHWAIWNASRKGSTRVEAA